MLLTVASEFLESTTNFGARLARHRGSDVLDVKDLQLHLGESAKTRPVYNLHLAPPRMDVDVSRSISSRHSLFVVSPLCLESTPLHVVAD